MKKLIFTVIFVTLLSVVSVDASDGFDYHNPNARHSGNWYSSTGINWNGTSYIYAKNNSSNWNFNLRIWDVTDEHYEYSKNITLSAGSSHKGTAWTTVGNKMQGQIITGANNYYGEVGY